MHYKASFHDQEYEIGLDLVTGKGTTNVIDCLLSDMSSMNNPAAPIFVE